MFRPPLIALALFLTLVSSAHAEPKCSRELAEAGISAKLGKLLQSEEWKKQMFEVRVLRGEVEGKARTLVLLGEVHVNSERGIAMARELREHFTYFALEGVNMKKMWARRFVAPALKGMYAAIGWLLGRRSGSTIADTAQATVERSPETASTIVSEVRKRVADLRARGGQDDDRTTVVVPGKKLRMTLAAFEKFANALDAEITAGTLPNHLYLLERDHRPALSEQLGFASVGALIYGYLGYAGWLAYNRYETLCTTSVQGIGDVCSAGGGVVVTGASVLGLGVLTAAVMGKVMQSTLVGDRNDTMVTKIVEAFGGDRNNQLMLTIVGQGHNKGMIELLTERYGFREIKLKTE